MTELDKLLSENATKGVDLGEVVALANRQLDLMAQVDQLEAQLKMAKAELNKVMLDELPSAMQAAGMSTFSLEDGTKISVKDEMTISVPKKRLHEILEKVREMGFGDLVTNEIIIPAGKGKDNAATQIMAAASELGLDATRVENINSASLKKLLSDRRKEGMNDDLPFFGAFAVKKATIK